MFQCYAATEPADAAIIDEFYDRLATSVDKTPNGDLILILGDFNAKVGSNNAAESTMILAVKAIRHLISLKAVSIEDVKTFS